MAVSKNALLDHFKLLQSALERPEWEAIMGLRDFTVYLRNKERQLMLQPQFLAETNGKRHYTRQLGGNAIMFAGWLPYYNKRWPIASDKLLFKQYATEAGLATPAHATVASSDLRDVVIKRPRSSFGEQVAGPLRSAEQRPLDPAKGEYYEQFIDGRIVKVWYWDEQPVCMEIDTMPSVMGDGISSIEKLILRMAQRNGRLPPAEKRQLLQRCDDLLHFHGVQRSTVLPAGKRQVVEFRYGTTLTRTHNRDVLDLQTTPHPQLDEQLRHIGQKLYQAIPEDIRRGTLYTVDAMCDERGKLWLLEMNSNPTVHPYAYRAMMRSLLAQAPRPQPDAVAAASARTLH
jgi:hypothetical protein